MFKKRGFVASMRLAALAASLLAGVGYLGCGAASEEARPFVSLGARPIHPEPAMAARIGRQALEEYGYEEIIRRAVKAHFLRYPDAPKPNSANLVGQTMEEAARQAWPVFTQWAVVAGITSQLDSPAPGPADVVALGELVVGLIHAGFIGVMVLAMPSDSVGSTTTAVPIPTTAAPSLARPQTCGTTYPDLQTCSSLPDKYTFPSAAAALDRMKKAVGDKGLVLHNEERARSGPCPDIGLHYNVRQGGRRAGSIVCCPCCMEGPPRPQKIERCRIVE